MIELCIQPCFNRSPPPIKQVFMIDKFLLNFISKFENKFDFQFTRRVQQRTEPAAEAGTSKAGNKYASEKGPDAFAPATRDDVRVSVQRDFGKNRQQTILSGQLRHTKGCVRQHESKFITIVPGKTSDTKPYYRFSFFVEYNSNVLNVYNA